ncbi:MAG: FAD-dependent oxidoreductase [Clostridia bacterium]|nr:FAD-binding protein [Oscillospiraceae bacterium]MBQ7960233.1 FAD-dependent oxidoreductase [Clostridia bacterium]
MYDIIIIGGGPAGLTAALYALRAEKSVVVIEKLGLGGQIALSSEVENFPGTMKMSGAEFAANLAAQVENLGGRIEYEEVVEIIDGNPKTVVTDLDRYEGRSIIIATGVKNRRLGAEGEEELIGKGVSFCAVCDGSFYKNKTVAVIGGGNTAVEDAIYLSDIAEKVYIVHRRDTFRAENRLVRALAERKNVELVLDSTVEKFVNEGGLKGIDVLNAKSGEKRHIALDGAFVAVGQIPQCEIFRDIIILDEGGYVSAGENCRTNVEGIFVAGDCRNKTVRQLTTAVGDGSVAALAAIDYLGN